MNVGPKAFVQGNLLLLCCCVFYLAWWLLAFRPENPIKGLYSGWLLIPAAVAGFGSVAKFVQGINSVPPEKAAAGLS